jgi:hypothetical protein
VIVLLMLLRRRFQLKRVDRKLRNTIHIVLHQWRLDFDTPLEDRVPTHSFLSMLAYYVEWHMKEA